jgi:flagellar protein FliS
MAKDLTAPLGIPPRSGFATQASAQRQYQELDLAIRIEASSPVELVSLLYEELDTAFGVMRNAFTTGRMQCARGQIERARSILMSLIASLDHEKGGALADSLANVYQALLAELGRLAATPDVARLDEMIAGFASVKTSWDSIAREQRG